MRLGDTVTPRELADASWRGFDRDEGHRVPGGAWALCQFPERPPDGSWCIFDLRCRSCMVSVVAAIRTGALAVTKTIVLGGHTVSHDEFAAAVMVILDDVASGVRQGVEPLPARHMDEVTA